MSGSLCISIDLELAWGIWDKPSGEYHARCEALEGRIVRALLAVLERHDISATWAIVGRLLERDERMVGTTPHGERIWFAPDLVEVIHRCPVPQDIGSHSYAHLYFAEATREQLDADVRAARRVHDAFGLPFTSFVFPRNQVDQLDLVRNAGIRVFRSVDVGWHIATRDRLGHAAGRLANLVDKAMPVPPTPIRPIPREGMVELASSMLLIGRNGLRRMIPHRALAAKAALGLRAARDDDATFHLWFHPSNFYYDTDRQLETFARIARTASAMRDRGTLTIRPMSAYAA